MVSVPNAGATATQNPAVKKTPALNDPNLSPASTPTVGLLKETAQPPSDPYNQNPKLVPYPLTPENQPTQAAQKS